MIGFAGWPMIRENIDFAVLGPQKFLKDNEKILSKVFQTSLLLLGEEMAKCLQ